eukprot:scaffold28941_cov88-Skeletonema_marinoi.AAC.1
MECVHRSRNLSKPAINVRRRKRALPARAETAKKNFINTHRVLSLIHGAAMSRVRPAMSSQIQELDNQHYVRLIAMQ